MMFLTLLVVADLCEIFSMVNVVQRTQYLEPTSLVFGHHYLECDCVLMAVLV